MHEPTYETPRPSESHKTGSDFDGSPSPPGCRMSGESKAAYQAFLAFWGLGAHRTLPAVAKLSGISESVVDRWSKQWRWSDRIGSMKRRSEEVRHAQAILEAEEMRERHISIARELLRLCINRVQAMNFDRMQVRNLLGVLRLAMLFEEAYREQSPMSNSETPHMPVSNILTNLWFSQERESVSARDDNSRITREIMQQILRIYGDPKADNFDRR